MRALFIVTLISFFIVDRWLKNSTGIKYTLDMMLYYDSEHVKELLQLMGHKGQEIYGLLHKVDYLFIVAFAALQIQVLYERAQVNPLVIRKEILYLPVILRGIADIGENITIDYLLHTYPTIEKTFVNIAYTMTFLKWIFLILFLVEIIYFYYRKRFRIIKVES